MSPSWKSLAASMKWTQLRCCVPIWMMRFLFRAASRMRTAASTVFETGFSQYTSLPAEMASIIIGLCQ